MSDRFGEHPVEVARAMMERYGLRAVAVAQERAAEAQAAGEHVGRTKWQEVASAIMELRRTRPITH